MTSQNASSLSLTEDNLGRLPAQIPHPAYKRANLTPAIVHIGVGGFHRAHQAVYLDDLLTGGHCNWSECGLGIMPQDVQMGEALAPQQCLYTVMTRGDDSEQARVIGAMTQYIHGFSQPAQALERLADPETRIVSLTVTEGGYYIDEASGELQEQHPNIQYDLAHPLVPRTVLGYLAEALARRKENGQQPFTVMSCDNLPGNGHITRHALLSFAELRDRELRAWIEKHVAFPNGMVDGITPVTTDGDREHLEKSFGIKDAWPVVTEPFRQWVLEDNFPAGRPPWELAGVQFTGDVIPYEKMKLRLLNAGHLALAYSGALHGFEFVHQAASDPVFRAYLERFLESVTPLIPPLAGVNLGEYKQMLVTRFSNRAIRDQISRICSEGSAKFPKFLLPSIMELRAAGRPTELLSAIVAGWFLYLEGKDEQGHPIETLDVRKAELQGIVNGSHGDPKPLLEMVDIFGRQLSTDSGFIEEVRKCVEQMRSRGVCSILQDLTGI